MRPWTEELDLIERLVQRLESHGESCCRLDARDREALRDAKAWLHPQVDVDDVLARIRETPETGPAVRAAFDRLDRAIAGVLELPDVRAARADLGIVVGATLDRFGRIAAERGVALKKLAAT